MKITKNEIANAANNVSTFSEIAVHTVAISRILHRGGDKEINDMLKKTHVGVAVLGLTAMAVEAICKR